MLPSIWTRCAGASRLAFWKGAAWRVVEAQHLVGTRGLVDNVTEQELLEQLIDRVKPPPPDSLASGRLHYLLAAPFRHPPLRNGSRFGTRWEPGIWYGALALPTALAEVAYYRLVFLEGTEADLTPLSNELTAFRAKLASERTVDLASGPFRDLRDDVSAPDRYDASQLLGREMRAAGVALFRYHSARDRQATRFRGRAPGLRRRGINVGVFDPDAIASPRPTELRTWRCVTTGDGVELSLKDYFRRRAHYFPRADFLADGRLPSPAT